MIRTPIRRMGPLLLAPLLLASCPQACEPAPAAPPATTAKAAPPTTAKAAPAPPTTARPAPAPAPPPANGAQFVATFNTPQDFYNRFRLDVHFRDTRPPNDGSTVQWNRVFPGDHDMSCNGPTTQRQVRLQRDVDGANRNLQNSQLFWWCAPGGEAAKGHVMTGMADVDGYTILSFSPNQAFTNVKQVCWDVNLTDLGGRKWTQVLVVPEDAYQRNGQRLDYISPVTQDVDQTALPMPAGSFMFQNWDHKMRLYHGQTEVHFDTDAFSTTDKARRYKHCMTDNRNGTVTVSQERDRGTLTRTVRGSFPARSRVIFQDDNYTPEKDGPIAGFTWHWDNIEIR